MNYFSSLFIRVFFSLFVLQMGATPLAEAHLRGHILVTHADEHESASVEFDESETSEETTHDHIPELSSFEETLIFIFCRLSPPLVLNGTFYRRDSDAWIFSSVDSARDTPPPQSSVVGLHPIHTISFPAFDSGLLFVSLAYHTEFLWKKISRPTCLNLQL